MAVTEKTLNSAGDTITLTGSNTAGTVTTSVSAPTYTFGATGSYSNPWATQSTLTSGKMTLLGDDADLVINGKSLSDTLARLEERLNILHVNQELESEWDELRALGDQYRKLEAHIQAKMATYRALERYDQT